MTTRIDATRVYSRLQQRLRRFAQAEEDRKSLR